MSRKLPPSSRLLTPRGTCLPIYVSWPHERPHLRRTHIEQGTVFQNELHHPVHGGHTGHLSVGSNDDDRVETVSQGSAEAPLEHRAQIALPLDLHRLGQVADADEGVPLNDAEGRFPSSTSRTTCASSFASR